MPKPRIDSLKPGAVVVLKYDGPYSGTRHEMAVFVKHDGEGAQREATFRSVSGSETYDWNAYRYDGRWAFGTSAERLSLVAVLPPVE